MLKLACILAAIAGFGLIGSAVAALTVFTPGGTIAGFVAAVSAGLLVAVGWTALILTFYRSRTAPTDEEDGKEEDEEEKSSSSRQKSSSSKR
jgi:mannitol-specific phosphotransferase system IIBC component